MWLENLNVTLVTKYPKLVLLVMASVTLTIFMVFMPKIEEKGTTSLLGENHISNVRLRQLREDYTGKPQTAMYIRLISDKAILSPETLTRLQKLTLAFENLNLLQPADTEELKAFAQEHPGEVQQRLDKLIEAGLTDTSWEELFAISEILKEQKQWTPKSKELFERIANRLNPITEVRSLANIDNIKGDGQGGLDISPFYEEIPKTDAEMQALKHDVEDNNLIAGSLYNPNYLGIILQSNITEADNKSLILWHTEAKRLLNEEYAGDEKAYMIGEPVVVSQMADGTKTMGKLMLVLMVLMLLILWVCLRWILGTFIPFIDAILSIMLAMALLPAFGVGLDAITSGIPIFLLTIGVADGIHMISVYREYLLEGLDKKAAVTAMLRKMFVPVSLTTFTTAIGFASLAFTEMVQIRHLGLFVAMGSMIALIYSFFLIPAMLMVVPANKSIARKGETFADRWLVGTLKATTNYAADKPKQVLGVMFLICLICGYGVTQLRVENDLLRSFFKENTPIVVASEEFKKTTGSSDLYVKLILKDNSTFKDLENLQELESLQKWLDGHEVVGKTFSLVDLLKRFNYVIHDDDPAYNRLPNATETEEIKRYVTENGKDVEKLEELDVSGQKLIAQYLFLYENQGGEDLSDIIDTPYKNALISMMVKTTSSRESLELLDDIQQYQRENMSGRFEVEFIGTTYNASLQAMEVIKGQVGGLASSVLLVGLIMCLVYRSFMRGMIGMVPMLFTIIVHFGLMGLFKVDMDWGSSMVSGLVIGIGVDYSIHYLSAFFKEIKHDVPYKQAMLNNIGKVGKPIMANALSLGVSFLVFLFCDVVPLIKIGITMSLTLTLSAVAALVITPALLSYFKPGFEEGQVENVGVALRQS